jgi:predicted metal-dependent hydrolase
MPVTAKLSQAFHDRLGHQVADEMVEWFNQVDLSYRHDLRELNELNFARFDAKMEQRLADFRASLGQRMSQLEVRFDRRLGEQSRWLVGIWITVIGAAIALWFRR